MSLVEMKDSPQVIRARLRNPPNAVVDNGNGMFGVCMRMGILVRRKTVGGPTRMGDPRMGKRQ